MVITSLSEVGKCMEEWKCGNQSMRWADYSWREGGVVEVGGGNKVRKPINESVLTSLGE
ncbi:hypothetical protein J6590_061525 [Homalodisca vitripennis]|nr:hypothetical protein J6590_061525 [Homalodisca vitripennis]